ncbi:MAG: hypothetical protein IIB60_00110 [Planctomycetes bacterium]|nr:hypothetical protein [Planctomycetota bacterium]
MNGTLIITLTLAQTDCVRGESVFFEVVIKNVSKNRIDGLPTLAAPQKSVVLEIAGRNGTRRAHQLSAMERDGIHRHADRGAPPTTSLDPGQAMSLRDDLLSWFGELEPGTFQVTARHGKGTISDAVPLEVLPANPVLVTTPRYAAQGPAARLSAAWVHKADDKFVLFYQHQSPVVPRNPIHGIRVVELEEAPTALYAPTLSGADVAKGHLLWSENAAG